MARNATGQHHLKGMSLMEFMAKFPNEKAAEDWFTMENAADEAKLYTDEARAYQGLPHDREAVNHSISKWVRNQAHTNGIESFWAMLKRGDHGTHHYMSERRLARCVNEFSGRHNVRPMDTIDQTATIVRKMAGKKLPYKTLTAWIY